MIRPPDFEELFDAEDVGDDAERLRRVHDLLVQAGPPPELSPRLASPPATLGAVRARRERAHRFQAGGLRYLAAAAAIAALAFGIGRVTARDAGDFAGARTVGLEATAAAPLASGVLEIGTEKSLGNWPMRLTTTQLPELKGKDYYAVFVTRGGKIVGLCGYFHAGRDRSEAYLNAPYALRGAGWIVTLQHRGDRKPGAVVLRTTV